MIKNIINELVKSKSFDKNTLYLIEKINDYSGFLYSNENVYFIIKSTKERNDSISTKNLSLRTSVLINTVENSPSFKPGKYDLLIYKSGNYDYMFNSFIYICKAYVNTQSPMSFIDFFYSLLNLFEKPESKSFTNLIGAFGELYFIKYMYEHYKINIIENWHTGNSSFDKYDFVFSHFNIEVKSTIKEEMIFKIKHQQIFNYDRNYVLVINLEKNNSGLTIKDLFDYFKNEPFSKNFNFTLKLEKEKNKISCDKFDTEKFSFNKLTIFSVNDLVTINNVPECINNIEYNYNFSGQKHTKLDSLFSEYLN